MILKRNFFEGYIKFIMTLSSLLLIASTGILVEINKISENTMYLIIFGILFLFLPAYLFMLSDYANKKRKKEDIYFYGIGPFLISVSFFGLSFLFLPDLEYSYLAISIYIALALSVVGSGIILAVFLDDYYTSYKSKKTKSKTVLDETDLTKTNETDN